jgi:hypothetical protein
MKVWTENTWKMEFYQRELKGGVVDAQDDVHLLIFCSLLSGTGQSAAGSYCPQPLQP